MENKFNQGDLVIAQLQLNTFYYARVIRIEGDDVDVVLIKDTRYSGGLFEGREITLKKDKIRFG